MEQANRLCSAIVHINDIINIYGVVGEPLSLVFVIDSGSDMCQGIAKPILSHDTLLRIKVSQTVNDDVCFDIEGLGFCISTREFDDVMKKVHSDGQ